MKGFIFSLTFYSIFFLSCNSHDKLWYDFWTDFKTVVEKNDAQGVVNLINSPLKGNFFEASAGMGLSPNGVIKNYGRIIGTNVREEIISAKEDEWSERKITSKNEAKLLGVPVDETVKILTLNLVSNVEEEYQIEWSQIFYFAKIDGDYKWCAMEIVG